MVVGDDCKGLRVRVYIGFARIKDLNHQSMYNGGPKPLETVRKAILLHALRFQLGMMLGLSGECRVLRKHLV